MGVGVGVTRGISGVLGLKPDPGEGEGAGAEGGAEDGDVVFGAIDGAGAAQYEDVSNTASRVIAIKTGVIRFI